MESLKDYLARFNTTTLEIYDLDQDTAMTVAIQGLHSSHFTYSLDKTAPKSYSKLLAWAQKYIHTDEGAVARQEMEGKRAPKKKKTEKGTS